MPEYFESSWRRIAAPIIRRVILENDGKPEKEIRAALRGAYPFGVRAYHPYKIWCHEIAVQMGKKPRRVMTERGGHSVAQPPDERQGEMFG